MDGSVAVSISAKTGVSVRKLRYHDEQQPLASKRSPGGQRTYPESVVERDRINRQISGLVSTRDRLDDTIGRPPPPGARAALPPARPLNGAGQGR